LTVPPGRTTKRFAALFLVFIFGMTTTPLFDGHGCAVGPESPHPPFETHSTWYADGLNCWPLLFRKNARCTTTASAFRNLPSHTAFGDVRLKLSDKLAAHNAMRSESLLTSFSSAPAP
jgi:hypothetical protein